MKKVLSILVLSTALSSPTSADELPDMALAFSAGFIVRAVVNCGHLAFSDKASALISKNNANNKLIDQFRMEAIRYGANLANELNEQLSRPELLCDQLLAEGFAREMNE